MANLTISRGDGLALVVSITSPATADTADYAFSVWARADDPLVTLRTADLTIVDGSPDTVTIVVPGSTTEDWTAGVYSYELKYQADVTSEPETIDAGIVVVRPSAIGVDVTV